MVHVHVYVHVRLHVLCIGYSVNGLCSYNIYKQSTESVPLNIAEG